MKPLSLFLSILLLAFGPLLSAQDFNCGSEIFRQKTFAADSLLAQKQQFHDAAARQFFRENKRPDAAPGVVTLPVVVHLMHDNGPENLSDAQVQQAIQWLNDAFANAGYYDQGSGTNTGLRFCLATRAPNGVATNGINRVQTALTELVLEDDDGSLKTQSRWDPTRYVNVWVVRSICSASGGCDIAGYATQPLFHGGNADGIVVEAAFFGSTAALTSPLVHEMGHYLGLYHTFQGGCANGDCLADGDQVCDTPPDQSTAALPCNQSANTCTTDPQSGFPTDQPDAFHNFLDYGNQACMHDLTPGQSDRMNFFVQTARQSLLASDGCGQPCPNLLTAAFMPSALIVDLGAAVTFTNQSQQAAAYNWTVNGQPFSTAAAPSYVFTAAGAFTVTLTATSADPALCPAKTATVVIQVICPAQADFLASDLEINTGQTVTFTNTSSDASVYEWFVNGVSQGPALPAYTFPSAGSYAIRLEAGNGSCERAKTLNILVQDSCTSSSFQKVFGTAADERGVATLVLSDGNFLLGGDGDVAGAGRELLFVRTDAEGNPLWSKRFGDPAGEERLLDLEHGPEGGFVALLTSTAWGGAPAASVAAFSVAGELLWQRRLEAPGESELRQLHAVPGGYIAAGYVRPGGADTLAQAYWLRLDAAGEQVWAHAYTLPGYSAYATDVAITGDTGYVASGYYYREDGQRSVLMLGLNMAGAVVRTRSLQTAQDEVLWNVHVLQNPLNPDSDGDFYFSGARIDYNIAFVRSAGLEINTDLISPFFSAGLYFSASQEPISMPGILAHPDGRIIVAANSPDANGQTSAQYFYKDVYFGDLRWSRKYSGLGQSRVSHVSETRLGEYLITGSTSASLAAAGDLYLLKTGASGLAGSCVEQPMQVMETFVQEPMVALTLVVTNPWPWIASNTIFSVQPYDLAPTLLCPAECATLPCKSAWSQSFGSGSLVAILPAPDGTYYAGARSGNRTVLLKFASDGTLLWQRRFHFASHNDRLYDLMLDSEGFLVGVGSSVYATIDFAGFAFKYDPVADVVLWVKEDAEEKRSRFTNVAEMASGGNYLVNGNYPTGTATEPDYNPILLELDRLSGVLNAGGWQTAFDLGQTDVFHSIKRQGDAWYAVGTHADPVFDDISRPLVVKFDLSGQVLWTRALVFPINNIPQKLEASDLAFDGDSLLITIHNGPNNSASNLADVFFLVKMAGDGQLLWTRKYSNQSPITVGFFLRNLVAIPDGYFLLDHRFLFRLNTDGTVRWVHGTGGTSIEGRRMLALGDESVYVAGKINGLYPSFLARIRASNGDIGNDCAGISSLSIVSDLFNDLYTEAMTLPILPNPLTLQENSAVSETLPPAQQTFLCGAPCQEYCDNGVSDDYDGLVDCFDDECDCQACAGETARHWYFGTGAGLDFATDPPTVLTDGQTDTPGATAVANDGHGNLLFYSDAETFYKANHAAYPGATGTKTSLNTIIVPLSSTQYWRLTPNADSLRQFYSLVTVPTAANLSGVSMANTPLYFPFLTEMIQSSLTEKIAVAGCSNFWWVVAKKRSNQDFQVFRLTDIPLPDSVFTLGTPAVDGLHNNEYGQIKFNHAGNLLANTLPGSGGFDLIRFDGFNGILSNALTVLLPELAGVYGLEFSPDDRLLYVATPLSVWQFDLSTPEAATIANSRVRLAQSAAPRYGALQLGPNGKIYVANGTTTPSAALDVIFQPNAAGLNCQYQENAQPLGAGRVHYGLPNFPPSAVQPLPPFQLSGPDSLCGWPATAHVSLNNVSCQGADVLSWTVSDSTNVSVTRTDLDSLTLQFAGPGVYALAVYAHLPCGDLRDTLTITVLDGQAPELELGPDLVVCENGVFTLRAGGGFARYRWSDGTADSLLTTPFPGKYWVTVWDACNQPQSDTVTISVEPASQLDLGPDQVGCRQAPALFARPAEFIAWQWSPPAILACDTCAVVTVYPGQATDYVVVARNADGCLSTDTVRVVADTLIAGLDTMLCAGAILDYLGLALPATDTTLTTLLLTPDGCDLLLTLTVTHWPAVGLTLPPDTTLKIGALLALSPVLAGASATSYAWSPPDGLSCTACLAPLAEALTDITYTLIATDANGCVAIDSITLMVNDSCGLRAPTAFTPDGDGTNETFYFLADPCVHALRNVRIFTRWGQEVYRAVDLTPNQPAQGWDGRVQGQDFPSDVLVWVAEVEYFDGRVERVMGEVTLLR